MRISVLLEGDVVAAVDETSETGRRPLRATVRQVLDTAKGGVVNLPRVWAGKRIVVVEVPDRTD